MLHDYGLTSFFVAISFMALSSAQWWGSAQRPAGMDESISSHQDRIQRWPRQLAYLAQAQTKEDGTGTSTAIAMPAPWPWVGLTTRQLCATATVQA